MAREVPAEIVDVFQASGAVEARTPPRVAESAWATVKRVAASLVPGARGLTEPAVDGADPAQRSVARNSQTFTHDRGLAGYVKLLDGSAAEGPFARALQSLRGGGHWLDSGGGDGVAVRELKSMAGDERVRATLVSYESSAEAEPGLGVLKGRFLEDIPDAEIPRSRLITDVYGPLAYSARPDEVMRKYAAALEPDGEIMAFLGSARDHFGSFDKVVTREGRVVDLASWLQSIPGLHVEVERRPIMDDEDVVAEAWVARMRRDPSVEARVPELEMIHFREGDQSQGEIIPHMMFREKGAPAVSREQASQAARAALEERTRDHGPQELLDAFRTGAFSNPLVGRLTGLDAGDAWINLGPVAGRFAERPAAFEGREHPRLAQWVMEKRVAGVDFAGLGYATSTDGGPARLLVDYYGDMLSSMAPDETLGRYLDALHEGGEMFVYLGLEKGGTGLETQVLTKDGRRLTLRGWLSSIPGLKVQSYRGHTVRDGGNRWIHDENAFLRISVHRREDVRIPHLELLGCSAPTGDGVPAPLFREAP